MSLRLLFLDEMKGFYKSKVMLILWIGMPMLSLLMHFLQAGAEDLPVSYLVGLVVASVGGTLASVVLSTSIVSEKNRNVYELFLIRPVKRYNLLLAKYLAVYSSLIVATLISIIVGIIVDNYTVGIQPDAFMDDTYDSIAISLAAMSISCSVGIFLGILMSSVAAAAIISIYIGNTFSLLSILPSVFLTDINPRYFAILVGSIVTIVFLCITFFLFRKKQL